MGPQMQDHVRRSTMSTRRQFMRRTAAALSGSLVASEPTCAALIPVEGPKVPAATQTGSDVGSLFPFIQSQAPRDFSLSFLRDEFTDVTAWKKQARGKLLELLHYAPPKCKPEAETVEKVDRGDYVQEKVYFNTTPDLRVPAYVLIPKKAKRPLPGIVALHDHGGFYLWGKEKLVEDPEDHPTLTAFQK